MRDNFAISYNPKVASILRTVYTTSDTETHCGSHDSCCTLSEASTKLI